MNAKQYNKLMPRTVKYTGKMIKAAAYMVDHECTGTDGSPIMGEARVNLVRMMCADMKFGENLTMKKHYVKGLIIGSMVGVGVTRLMNKIKTKKTEEES